MSEMPDDILRLALSYVLKLPEGAHDPRASGVIAQAIWDERKRAWEEHRAAGAKIAEAQMVEIDLVRAEHAGADWQPIETAPKDGTAVLVVRMDGVATAYRQPKVAWFGPHKDAWINHEAGRELIYPPTHWMPLPPPPSS